MVHLDVEQSCVEEFVIFSTRDDDVLCRSLRRSNGTTTMSTSSSESLTVPTALNQ